MDIASKIKQLITNKINTSHIADNVTLNDIEYVNGYGVAVALEGDDDGAQSPLNNSFLYNPENNAYQVL